MSVSLIRAETAESAGMESTITGVNAHQAGLDTTVNFVSPNLDYKWLKNVASFNASSRVSVLFCAWVD